MLGLGCFLATFNLFLRDTYHLIGVFLTVWMFATPIFYPERMVRDAGYGWFLDLNPMHWLIQCYRRVLVYGAWPDLRLLLTFALVSLVILVAGSSFFMTQKPRFPDLL
jgi:ABC-type polysaccharide/polyol phosphate export permease